MEIEQLYNEYFSIVYRYVLSLSRNPCLAEEITQEVERKNAELIKELQAASVLVWKAEW